MCTDTQTALYSGEWTPSLEAMMDLLSDQCYCSYRFRLLLVAPQCTVAIVSAASCVSVCVSLSLGPAGDGVGLLCVFLSQWVLAFEIFIPLVLFFILLGLRLKKPSIPVKEGKTGGSARGERGIELEGERQTREG